MKGKWVIPAVLSSHARRRSVDTQRISKKLSRSSLPKFMLDLVKVD